MALDDLKEKLKKPFHRSKHRRSTSTTESTSYAGNRSSVASDIPAHDRLSYDQNGASTTTTSKPPATPATPASNYTSSRQGSIASLEDSSRPGLHNIRNTEYELPQVPQEQDFSSGFTGLTLGSQEVPQNGETVGNRMPTQLDEGRNSENIANRNLNTSTQDTPSVRLVPQPDEKRKSQPLIPNVDHHASNVADWNMVRNDDPTAGSRNDAPQPLIVRKRVPNQHETDAVTDDNLVHDRGGARDMSWSVTPLAMEGHNDESPLDARGKISNLSREAPITSDAQLPPPQSNLNKSLPATPSATVSPDEHIGSKNRELSDTLNIDEGFLARAKQDSAGPFNLEGVDVEKAPDTVSLHEYHAPAVTHETIKTERHETRQQVITRETHDYHIYHRILPIIDIEVLPARHFVPIQHGLVEIDEEELPGRTRDKVNWAIAEMVSKRMPESRDAAIARQFTARTFEGTEGDDRQYVGPEGHPVQEKWWVHPPTLCEDAYRAGQTYPFHFGSADPKDDGLKATLPTGNVVGVSRRLMEKRQREAKQMAAADDVVQEHEKVFL